MDFNKIEGDAKADAAKLPGLFNRLPALARYGIVAAVAALIGHLI